MPAPRAHSRGAKRFHPRKYTAWKEALQWMGLNVPDEAIITFYVPMPPSWSQKKKVEMAGMPHQQRPDLDNYLKALMDAARREDSGIYRVDAIKLWAHEGAIVVETPTGSTPRR